MILLGILTIIISLIGLIGAALQKPILLNAYGYIIFFLVIAEIILFYYGFKFKDQFSINLENGIRNAMRKYTINKHLAISLQYFQLEFKCCGFNGPEDYYTNTSAINLLPASCCNQRDRVKNDSQAQCIMSEVQFKVGCKNGPFINALGSMTSAAYFMILLQLLVILCACCLSRDILATSSSQQLVYLQWSTFQWMVTQVKKFQLEPIFIFDLILFYIYH